MHVRNALRPSPDSSRPAFAIHSKVGAVLLGLLASGGAAASDAIMADALGQGGVTLADPDGLGIVTRAPAVMSLRARYDLAGSARIGPYTERTVQAAALDSRTGPVALGLAYLRRGNTPPTREDDLPGWQEPGASTTNPTTEMVAGGGISGAWFQRSLGVGLSGVYVGETTELTEPVHRVEMGASVAGRVGESFVWSAMGENLLPGGAHFTPLRTGVGLRLMAPEVLGFELDGVLDLESADRPAAILRAGLDGRIQQKACVRGGFVYDGVNAGTEATLGLGVSGATGQLDYGIKVGLGGGVPSGLMKSTHAVSVRFRL